MNITKLKTNHIRNPLGFLMPAPVISYVVENCAGARQRSARVWVYADAAASTVIYDSGECSGLSSCAFPIPIALTPATRYYWRVSVTADNGECAQSELAWFETAKAPETLVGEFIASTNSQDVDYFEKTVTLSKPVQKARAYASALGAYELYINGTKAGTEYFAPGSNDYDSWLQYQTFDVSALLRPGSNTIVMVVSPGWYSGYFGYTGKNHIYGTEKAVFCDLELTYEDGSTQTICTDKSWLSGNGMIRYAEIYHGEKMDATILPQRSTPVCTVNVNKQKLTPRKSLPVVIKERITPKALLKTPAGETVIDMGQNMAGWLAFICREPTGGRMHLQYGELLQNGNFYRGNLYDAKAEQIYVSNGEETVVRPHFTYFGFRYVKISGYSGTLNLEDFWGEVVYSDLDTIGELQTGNPLVNRLIQNAVWGQKSNFLEVPTDCPQRSERMGWTGDAQIFSGTAAFQMDVSAFYSKFMYDLMQEQRTLGGRVPMTAPSFHMHMEEGWCSAAWADAATIIPWTVYLYSGDRSILEQQYPSMRQWVEYVHCEDERSGNKHLWTTGFHYGDWLALDAEDPETPIGATDVTFVASCYYYLSTLLTAKTAHLLSRETDAAVFFERAKQIKTAIQNEFFTPNGRLAMTTQTGYVLALAFDVCPVFARERIADDLYRRLKKDHSHLKTGFVGTPYLCRVLSEYGHHDMAMQLLMNEDCPSWLYPVKMGATTIWERWDSVLPDGTINPIGMNSLNHYAYGSIVEWIYRNLAGLQPCEDAPGFRKAIISPLPSERLKQLDCRYDSPYGRYEVHWRVESGSLSFRFVIPFQAEAVITLPDADLQSLHCGNPVFISNAVQTQKNVVARVPSGVYEITCLPTDTYGGKDFYES